MLDHARPYLQQRLATVGRGPAEIVVLNTPGHEWLIEARERGNDAILEVRDAAGHLVAQADHPERRTGTRRVIIPPLDSPSLALRVTGKEHAAVTGTAEIRVIDLKALAQRPACVGAYHSLAAADADYAIGQQISLGLMPSATQTAREEYQRAAEEYLAAEILLEDPSDATLRGETALAIAGVRYFDLQDWRGSVEWAGTAEDFLEGPDPYRRARAQALAAAAWIEMAAAAPRASGAGSASGPTELLGKARRTLEELAAFHLRRHERYDAALQINNIALTYLYEGRFRDCVAESRSAGRLFGELGENPRQALAWQNRALCYWGLGHLPEALDTFNQALKGLAAGPYPRLYLLTLNNTALMNYALGHFDDALRLQDQALALAIHIQNRLEQAQSLYGIGVTYYALGDRDLAREFLERALAIRTPALDGRGRRATLRSLATVYADLGEYRHAIDFDREALTLATAPTSRARSRIQLAVHTALVGNTQEALDILTELLLPGALNDDPLTRAQALLQRATIERRSGASDAALGDLAMAIPVFRNFRSVTDGFAADLERARILQLAGRESEALAAVDEALGMSEAIRAQTANPEFRAQLQLPLRPAYDLKLDLLWERYDGAVKAGDAREAGRIAALAFRAADAARARSFADVAAQRYSTATRRDIAGDLAHREALYRQMAGLRFSFDTRLDRSGSADPRAKELKSEIAGLEREIDTVNTRIAARTATRGPAAGSAGLVPGGAIPVPADAAIIAYWLGSESTYSWAVTPAGIHWVRLAAPATITAAARAFHDSLNRLGDVPRETRMDTAAVLYEQILRPLDHWVAPYQRWFFIPDGALDYVPYAALRPGSRADSVFVVSAHDVALAPAAWMLLAPRPPSVPTAHARILLVSDPVYELSDPRLTVENALQHPPQTPASADSAAASLYADRPYQRIPWTAREATGIQAEFPVGQVDALTGTDATRERLLKLDWSKYRFIHIASHGYLDARMPQLSALILSTYDQRGQRIEEALRAADLSVLTLKADVAVFSGCDTALGKEVLNEGMVGIAYATLARGAGAVVSSLWQVPDEIGARLMTEFYRHLVRDSMSTATALSASMRSILDRNPSADPALWAAFQVSVVSIARQGPQAGRSQL